MAVRVNTEKTAKDAKDKPQTPSQTIFWAKDTNDEIKLCLLS